jgi:hypothetical protein
MSSKFRILSFHHITNNGAFLFAYSLCKLFQEEIRTADIKIINYKSPRLAFYEYLKRFNFLQGIPLFYWRRSQIWQDFIKKNLDLDGRFPHSINIAKIQRYLSKHSDVLIVGMDVWCIVTGTERPLFPNIYWLPERMEIPKIAYGVSAYNSENNLVKIHQEKISKYLNGFDVIGSRDRFTHNLVTRYRTRSSGLVERIPDPTFHFQIKPTNVRDKLSQIGLDFERPILGLLLFGHRELSQEIKRHFQSKGYQIIALSMYNPFADFNLGHLLNPFEWAEAFQLLSFCITDRFHGTIFCLKNQTPFICIEKDAVLPKSQSKIFDLLSEFNLTNCYVNPTDEDFSPPRFLQLAAEIESNWNECFKPDILPKIEIICNHHLEFIQKMKIELNF